MPVKLKKKKKVHNCIAGYEGKFTMINRKINFFKNGYVFFYDLFTIKQLCIHKQNKVEEEQKSMTF